MTGLLPLCLVERRAVVISALDFISQGRWYKASPCHRVVSLDEKVDPTLSLSTQVQTAGGNPAMKRVPYTFYVKRDWGYLFSRET